MDHSRPDRHDPPTHESSGTHAPEDALGTASPTSDGWLRTVLENTSDVICVLAPDGSFHYISPAVKWVLGYLPEDLIGRVGFDYVHIEDAAFAAESFAQILKTPGLHAPLQFRVQTAPRTTNVAAWCSQYSPVFGQRASSHTVWRPSSRMRCLSRT